MAMVAAQQSAENMEYMRKLHKQKGNQDLLRHGNWPRIWWNRT